MLEQKFNTDPCTDAAHVFCVCVYLLMHICTINECINVITYIFLVKYSCPLYFFLVLLFYSVYFIALILKERFEQTHVYGERLFAANKSNDLSCAPAIVDNNAHEQF